MNGRLKWRIWLAQRAMLRLWGRLRRRCWVCGLRAPYHKMSCSSWRR